MKKSKQEHKKYRRMCSRVFNIHAVVLPLHFAQFAFGKRVIGNVVVPSPPLLSVPLFCTPERDAIVSFGSFELFSSASPSRVGARGRGAGVRTRAPHRHAE